MCAHTLSCVTRITILLVKQVILWLKVSKRKIPPEDGISESIKLKRRSVNASSSTTSGSNYQGHLSKLSEVQAIVEELNNYV